MEEIKSLKLGFKNIDRRSTALDGQVGMLVTGTGQLAGSSDFPSQACCTQASAVAAARGALLQTPWGRGQLGVWRPGTPGGQGRGQTYHLEVGGPTGSQATRGRGIWLWGSLEPIQRHNLGTAAR